MQKSWKHLTCTTLRWVAVTAVVLPIAGLILSFAHIVHFDIKGHWDGIFLLKGKQGWKYEIKDDLYVGDGHRFLWGVDVKPAREHLTKLLETAPERPYIFYEWDREDGSGYVRNFLADGTQLFTAFGRFSDDGGGDVRGLFVGGGLPRSIIGNDNVYMNNSGMSFHDGRRWYHIWCNANEGIISATTNRNIPPSSWKFLGSRVLDQSSRTLAITSSHLAEVDGVPLKVQRFMYMKAGDTYFILTIRVTNTGTVPVSYYYAYGDEPWVGNYGSSAGNVGWVSDGIVGYESGVDSIKHSYAGIFDYGNEVIGEPHRFTMKANFIEWFGDNKPNVYFSNGDSERFDPSGKTPLSSNTRFIGLQWGPRTLSPQQTDLYVVAVGMALHDPQTGFPVKPQIVLNQTGSAQIGPPHGH